MTKNRLHIIKLQIIMRKQLEIKYLGYRDYYNALFQRKHNGIDPSLAPPLGRI